MGLLFVDESLSLKTPLKLDILRFNSEGDGKYFSLSNSKEDEVRIPFVPVFDSEWDEKLYLVYLFENPYLTAENDIFQLFTPGSTNKRLGWIFPVNALDSNEHSYASNSNFNHYRTVAYKHLLKREIKVSLQEFKQSYSISELFPNQIVCVINKLDIGNQSINDYLLSLMQFDYLLFNDSLKGKKVYEKSYEIDSLRKGNHKLRLRPANFVIVDNPFTKSLFIDHLLQSESSVVRFISLYQIFEHLIQESGDKLVDDVIAKYQSKKISKNSVKEQLSRMHNDNFLLGKIISSTTIKNSIKNDFIESYQILLDLIGEEKTADLATSVYGFRNLFTHRYRVVSNNTAELNKVIQNFESFVLEFLINYNSLNDIKEENVVAKKSDVKAKTLLTIDETMSLWKKIVLVIEFHFRDKFKK